MIADASVGVFFPPPWFVLPVDPSADTERIDALVEGLRELSDDSAQAGRRFFDRLGPTLARLGIAGVAALAVGTGLANGPADDTGNEAADNTADDAVLAFVAIGTGPLDPRNPSPDHALREVATGDAPEAVVEHEVAPFEVPSGTPCVRAVTMWHATELADETGLAPFVARARYALPLSDSTAVVVHFVTPTVAYLDELLDLFDAMVSAVDLSSAQSVAAPAPDPETSRAG